MKHEIICDKNRNVIKNTRPCIWEWDAIGKQFSIISFLAAGDSSLFTISLCACRSFVRFGSFQRSEEIKGKKRADYSPNGTDCRRWIRGSDVSRVLPERNGRDVLLRSKLVYPGMTANGFRNFRSAVGPQFHYRRFIHKSTLTACRFETQQVQTFRPVRLNKASICRGLWIFQSLRFEIRRRIILQSRDLGSSVGFIGSNAWPARACLPGRCLRSSVILVNDNDD